jgi:hypothetical protein
MELIAERATGRREGRAGYRTMSRMQRRRSFVQDRLGMKEDFSSRTQPGGDDSSRPGRVRA